jgi:hypothetical protein
VVVVVHVVQVVLTAVAVVQPRRGEMVGPAATVKSGGQNSRPAAVQRIFEMAVASSQPA